MRRPEATPRIRFREHHSVPQNPGFEPPFRSRGGAPSGAPRMAGGAPTKKAGHRPALNCLAFFGFFRAGEEIRTLDVNLGKTSRGLLQHIAACNSTHLQRRERTENEFGPTCTFADNGHRLQPAARQIDRPPFPRATQTTSAASHCRGSSTVPTTIESGWTLSTATTGSARFQGWHDHQRRLQAPHTGRHSGARIAVRHGLVQL